MLLLTDLADWTLDPLGALAEPRRGEPVLTPARERARQLLQRVFAAAARPRLGQARSGAVSSDWLALAVARTVPFSQYDVLLDIARAPERLPGALATLALTGDGFHGNRGRSWLAERGNLHLCCAMPADLDLATAAAAVPALASVAVIDALARCAPELRPQVKWVNDILVGGAKVAGVLSGAQTRGSRLLALTFGIGVNVAVAPAVVPTLFVPRATCLHAQRAAAGVRLGDLTAALLDALSARLDELHAVGPSPVVAAYRRACGDLGRQVAVWAEGTPDADDARALPPPLAVGRAVALTDELHLVVEGAANPLYGGRLAYRDAPEAARAEPPTSVPEPPA